MTADSIFRQAEEFAQRENIALRLVYSGSDGGLGPSNMWTARFTSRFIDRQPICTGSGLTPEAAVAAIMEKAERSVDPYRRLIAKEMERESEGYKRFERRLRSGKI